MHLFRCWHDFSFVSGEFFQHAYKVFARLSGFYGVAWDLQEKGKGQRGERRLWRAFLCTVGSDEEEEGGLF
jgi:hypothetical protein